jgi:RNA-binding protein YlmH
MTKDELITARIEDKISQCRDGYYVTSTGFLDTHEQALAIASSRHAAGVRTFMYGGYDEAERRMLVCVPRDLPVSDGEAVEGLLRVLRVKLPAISRELSHRDYLGSLLALGIDREVTGDILVRPRDEKSGGGADIIVEESVAQFIEMHYDKAGRTNLNVEILPVDRLDTGEQNIVQKHDTVASLRLDNIVSSAFALSRAKAAEAIRRGIVSVNSMESLKVDQEISEGDKIVLRGKGKAVLAEAGGRSRKDRIIVTFNLYK